MRRIVVLTALVALALPVQAARANDDHRPFRRGTILPSVALGGSFSRNYGGSLLVGAGASYFVVGGLAVGLHLRNVSTFYSQGYKDSIGPTLLSQIPTNEFSLTPSLLWVIYRGERVAPYVSFGLGPVFLNKKRGVLGQWTIGPGVMIRLGGLAWLDLGIGVGMRFTNDRCERAYTFLEGSYSYYPDYACSFNWGFRGGIVFGIGGRRSTPQPSPRPSPAPSYNPPPASSYPPPQSYPPPAQPVPSASPPPSPTPPVAAPPEGPPTPATPPPTPATPPPTPLETPSPANPPATPPPATTTPTETSPVPPPGENLPIPPPA